MPPADDAQASVFAFPDNERCRARLEFARQLASGNDAVLAVLADVETWDAMELDGKERLPLLKKFLELPAGIPSHDTFNRVFSLLHPKSLETALQEWITSLISSVCPLDSRPLGD